jgi:hypothetical protein
MTTSEAFQAFKSNLELPDKKYSQASTAQQKIRSDIGKYLTIEESFLSGSYARYTKIDPLQDIDIILVRNDSRVQLSSSGGTTPTDALEQVRTAVAKAYPTAKIKLQSRSVNVQIPSVSFGFDLVPAWLRLPDGYWIPDADSGGWMATDPNKHAELMTFANELCQGRLKPVVKMMKHWNTKNLDLMRSFHVELLCRDILIAGAPSSFQECVAKVLGTWPQLVGKPYFDPVYKQSRIDKTLNPDELGKLLSRIQYDAGNAQIALSLEKQYEHGQAIAKWKTIFLSGFPG